jgi:ABC-type phosphate transport system auxiliary subunit
LWLISALSGTLEIEAEIESLRLDRERMRLENEKLDEIILQTRNETKRLSELESKLDGLFSKYNINLGAPTKPQQ